jgi:RNA polymerase sigma-70 factor (ECF subfamily)
MPGDSTMQLQILLDRLKAGNLPARDELIECACARLRRLIHKLFHDYPRVRQFDDSSDVMQEVLLRLVRRLRNLMGEDREAQAQFPATVREFFRLATNEIRHALLDLARKYFGPLGRGRHEVREADLPQDAHAAGQRPDPGDSSQDPAKLEWWSEFHRQVETLLPEEREVFELRWYQGLSSEEAAEILGVSLATVKRRWLQARLALQPLLEKA